MTNIRTLKKWYLEKLTHEERVTATNGILAKETEKALKVERFIKGKGYIGNGRYDLDRVDTVWIPKSVILTEEAEEQRKQNEEKEQAITSGLEYYERMIEWAKAQGVKGVRKRMKSVKLYQLIKQAGLEAPKSFKA